MHKQYETKKFSKNTFELGLCWPSNTGHGACLQCCLYTRWEWASIVASFMVRDEDWCLYPLSLCICACCHSRCEFIYASVLLSSWICKTVSLASSNPHDSCSLSASSSQQLVPFPQGEFMETSHLELNVPRSLTLCTVRCAIVGLRVSSHHCKKKCLWWWLSKFRSGVATGDPR